jgi:hypothetical protein
LTESINKEYSRRFCEEVLPLLPSEVKLTRETLTEEIRLLLARCRRCKSWCDHSEDKLMEWIEFVDEKMIPHTSVPRMLRLKKNLTRLHEIYLDMDTNGTPQTGS